ncbi:MAG TPA: aldo/keto reductase [Jatrophihabitans sp.]|jgi:aryl-alcohol dehydrogenase-like predicted oxidoreductase|uniref:aldo/keto reductase n=1 Tax=Jatrophihabitans sp. TaxID=1932789 RepID=UPI002EEAB21D
MRYRKLGSSDLEVSEIALGLVYAIGVEVDLNRRCIEAAFDAGITFFNTANAYGRGAAEEALGNILSQHRRDSYVLATTVWGQMSDDETDRGLSAAQIAKQIDASLRRLRVDFVDLYQAHRFDPDVPVEETVEALQKVVQQGKARYLGFSEWTSEQINAAIEIGGPELFVSSQPQYSLLWRAPEAEIFRLCARHQISHVVWSPLGEGVLTGKYRPGQAPPPGSRAAGELRTSLMDPLMSERTLQAVERLRPIASGACLTMPQLALAWVLRRPEVASAITGASNPGQVHANAAASAVVLSDDVLEAVDEALGDVPVTGQRLAPLAEPGVRHRD